MPLANSVLIISGDSDHRQVLAEVVSGRGLHPVFCASLSDAKALLCRGEFDAIFSDAEMTEGHFTDVVGNMRERKAKPPVIVISRIDDWSAFLNALARGAFDYVVFPPNPGEIDRSLSMAINESRRSQEMIARAVAA
jgi:DNA-binding NtrC family response regulator